MNRKPKIDMLNIVVSYDAITYIFVAFVRLQGQIWGMFYIGNVY